MIPALLLFIAAVFVFSSAAAAAADQKVPLLYPVGNVLFSFFSFSIFFIPLLMIFCGSLLISERFPRRDGFLFAGLTLLPLTLSSLFLNLLTGPKSGTLFFRIKDNIVDGYGSTAFYGYLIFLLIAMCIGLLAVLRVIVLSVSSEGFNYSATQSSVGFDIDPNEPAIVSTPASIPDEIFVREDVKSKKPAKAKKETKTFSKPQVEVKNSESRHPAATAVSILDEFPNVKRLYEAAQLKKRADLANPEAANDDNSTEIRRDTNRFEAVPSHLAEASTAGELRDAIHQTESKRRTPVDLNQLERAQKELYPENSQKVDPSPSIKVEDDEVEVVNIEPVIASKPIIEEEDQTQKQSYEAVEGQSYEEDDDFLLLDDDEFDDAAYEISTGKPLMNDVDPGLQFLQDGFDSQEIESDEEAIEELADSDSLLGDDSSVLQKSDDELQEEDAPAKIFSAKDSVNPIARAINIDPGTPATVSKRISTNKAVKYEVPVDSILNEYGNEGSWEVDDETRRNGDVLQKTLEEFKIAAEVTGIRKGPVITMFEILPAPGVKLSKIVNLADNIALRLAASRVRIVAPIPGKHAVGIEIPNKKRALVSFKEMVEDKKFCNKKLEIPVILGKDITGNAQIIDLTQTPHLLIAGATGSGKSVCVNSLITSILYSRRPQEVKLLLIDPKIVELKLYNDVPHLLTPVITEAKKAYQALQYCLCEMERRYALLDSAGCRDIKSFNKRVKTRNLATESLPYIVVIIDEFADLMATTGKELESTLARLAAMSRAVGIHLVLATQRPSIDVITGIIKANIPSRIAFMVAGKFDSRIILDSVGAEKLLGKGDMLFSSAWEPVPTRIQGAFLSDEEVENVVAHVKTLGEPDYIDDEIFIDEEDGNLSLFSGQSEDPLTNKALEVVMLTGKASASYLQRRLKIGYNRAARLVEDMEDRGIVGPQNGSKPRQILVSPDQVGIE